MESGRDHHAPRRSLAKQNLMKRTTRFQPRIGCIDDAAPVTFRIGDEIARIRVYRTSVTKWLDRLFDRSGGTMLFHTIIRKHLRIIVIRMIIFPIFRTASIGIG